MEMKLGQTNDTKHSSSWEATKHGDISIIIFFLIFSFRLVLDLFAFFISSLILLIGFSVFLKFSKA